MGYIYVLAAIIFTSFGLISYKIYSIYMRWIFLLLTIFLFLLAPICSFYALQWLTVDVVYMATSINGFIVLVLSHLLLKEVVIARQYIGALLVFVGVIIYMV